MSGVKWKDQIIEGRVFELRSTSKRYAAPCAVVIRPDAGYSEAMVAEIDRLGVIGHGLYHRRTTNPQIYVDGYRGDEFIKRIARRRPDLERFDCFDLDLIRNGYSLDFDGRIGGYSMPSIPLTRPAVWTVFWLAAYDEGDLGVDFGYSIDRLMPLFRGAWHFHSYGGARRLGYKYGHVWATRHTGMRLRQIRGCLQSVRPDVIEQEVRVVRWSDSKGVYTSTLQRECPPLGSGMTTLISPGSIQGWMSGASNTVIHVGAR